DSIPAIFGLTQEPYIVFTATAFSLMGLRQLYFLIDGLLDRLVYLSYGLSAVLGFIGVKLVLHALHENNLPFINDGENVPVAEIPTTVSLGVIVVILAITVVTSLYSPKGRALRALQNAERYSHRYSKLIEPGKSVAGAGDAAEVSDEERTRAEELMDRWTREAEAVAPRYRDELLDHKDKYSEIIRTAHETRLASARARGQDAEVAEQTVDQQGPTVGRPTPSRGLVILHKVDLPPAPLIGWGRPHAELPPVPPPPRRPLRRARTHPHRGDAPRGRGPRRAAPQPGQHVPLRARGAH